jgi:hypothetical protein
MYCDKCADCERENDRLKLKINAIVKWLEQNQPDVFSRGMWDAISKSNNVLSVSGERGEPK